MRLKPHVAETGEMQHTPEAVASVREVIACGCGTRGGIEATEDHVKAIGEDIWVVVDQAAPGQRSTERQMIIGVPGRCDEFLVIGSEIGWEACRSRGCAYTARCGDWVQSSSADGAGR